MSITMPRSIFMTLSGEPRTNPQIQPELCEPLPQKSFQDSFNACLNNHGVYESQKFALRLSPRIHELVDSAVQKAESGSGKLTAEEFQAYSTFIHETVHWWQHKGSTSGFVRSLMYPLQTHAHLNELREVLAAVGPEKPVVNVALKGELGLLPEHAAAIVRKANSIANGFMDTEFFLAQTYSEAACRDVASHPYFQTTGHSTLISYSQIAGALRGLLDEEGHFLEDPEALMRNLERLRDSRTTGYYLGSDIHLPPVGVRELYEGQARFIQLQFLSGSIGLKTMSQARDAGLLSGMYVKAFNEFLRLGGLKEPTAIDDPIVALFLLVCDMAINPTAGFPAKVEDYEYFYFDVDPGIRFATLMLAVKALPETATIIVDYSAEEYRRVVDMLSRESGMSNHLLDLEAFLRAVENSPSGQRAIEEHRTFEFSPSDIVLRVLVGEFLSYTTDRLEHPNFFCWAGYWMTKASDGTQDLWLKHLSLASDRADEETLFPRRKPGIKESVVSEVFNQFFVAVILFDLTRQWVLREGPFDLDYGWLTAQSSEPGFRERLDWIFEKHYGVKLDQFRSIPDPRLK